MFVPWIQASCSQMSAIAICGSLWRPLAFLYWPSWACFLDFWKTKDLPVVCLSTHWFLTWHFTKVVKCSDFFFGRCEIPLHFLHMFHTKIWHAFLPWDHLFIRVRSGGGQPTASLQQGSTPLCCSMVGSSYVVLVKPLLISTSKTKVADMYLLLTHIPWV